jgi:hypothetical protein
MFVMYFQEIRENTLFLLMSNCCGICGLDFAKEVGSSIKYVQYIKKMEFCLQKN